MSFTKSSVLGFGVGFIAAVGVSMIRVKTPAYVIDSRKKEKLNKKETIAKLNDANEDREILFEIVLLEEGDLFTHLDTIRLKAVTEPRWAKLLAKIEEKMKEL